MSLARRIWRRARRELRARQALAAPGIETAQDALLVADATEPPAPPDLASLTRDLQDATTEGERQNAIVRLVALAPIDSAGNATDVFEVLAKGRLWSQFLTYAGRLPESVQEMPQVEMMRAICTWRLGNGASARPRVHRALLAANGYTISTQSHALLRAHLDAESLLQEALEEIRAGRADRDTLTFAFLVAYHDKRMQVLETLLKSDHVDRLRQEDALLLFQSARAARATRRMELAAELIFAARRLDPHEGLISTTAIDTARACPSDLWVKPGIRVGEEIRHKLQNIRLLRQVLVGLARLYARHDDPELAALRLAELAEIDLPLDTVALAIARSQFQLGLVDAAEETLARFAESHPHNSTVLFSRAGLLAAVDRGPEAIALVESSMSSKETPANVLALIGHIHAWSGESGRARPWLAKARLKAPDQASALADLSLCAEFDRDYTLALSLAERACTEFAVANPMPSAIGLEFMHMNRLRRRMMFLADMSGNEPYARALQREAIAGTPLELPYRIEEWSGETIDGQSVEIAGRSAMVVSELGIGDEIRYLSVLPVIAGAAAHVTMSCDPRLAGLMRRSFPDVTVMPVQREFPGIQQPRLDSRTLGVNEAMRKILSDDFIRQGEAADLWIRARHFFEARCLDRSRLVQSPEAPVLTPDPALAESLGDRIAAAAGGRRVLGLSWRGGRRTYNREPHYFELHQWAPLLAREDLCFVNLQYAVQGAELDWLRATLGERFIELPDLDLFDDMEGVAALCSRLDLVLAICTSVLELASAVGTPSLYLMRSPQVTHAIRLAGRPDRHGVHRDAVWAPCRILPRFDMSDEDMVRTARAWLDDHFDSESDLPT